MQEYNTQLANIRLPEYGRNVQSLVNYCKTIPDRERRNACASSIIGIMADIYPDLAEVSGRKNILWDHLAIIANFELDIDYPCEVMKPEELQSKPAPIVNTQSRIRNRMYGKRTEELINVAKSLEDPQERISLFGLIANQMKRNFHSTNKDASEEDNKILNDLTHFAGEEFRDEIYQVTMQDTKSLSKNEQYDPSSLVVTKKKKKKKK